MSNQSATIRIPSLLPTPDIFSCRRILVIQPHYDDADIAAGAPLRRSWTLAPRFVTAR